MADYRFKAKGKGRFDSKLENKWDWILRFRFLGVEYIGDRCNFADFKVEDLYIEIKPHGISFVIQAHERAVRYRKSIIIIEGDSEFSSRWWVSTSSGKLSQIEKPGYRETIKNCLLRNGLVFI